jgi:hypothetical protein
MGKPAIHKAFGLKMQAGEDCPACRTVEWHRCSDPDNHRGVSNDECEDEIQSQPMIPEKINRIPWESTRSRSSESAIHLLTLNDLFRMDETVRSCRRWLNGFADLIPPSSHPRRTEPCRHFCFATDVTRRASCLASNGLGRTTNRLLTGNWFDCSRSAALVARTTPR